jgi:hypothetical protein
MMVHIATVHWQNDSWIDIQLRYLNRHVSEPFRVYAFLNGISEAHTGKYFYASTEPIRGHAAKLNILSDVIRRSQADDSDILIFLDGDAFPIDDIVPLVREKLEIHPLVAVQRFENNGDRQPHPCFCATTVGFWNSIGGDWAEGHSWADSDGRPTTDVGGNLLGILETRGIEWCPLHRTNRRNLHPLWFGIYGNAVYHHGAGFRSFKVSRADLQRLAQARGRLPPAGRITAGVLDRLLRRSPIRALRACASLQKTNRHNTLLSEEMFESIKRDDLFYKMLMP